MIKDIIKYGIGEAFTRIAPFFITLYVANLFEPDVYGSYTLLISLYELLFIFIGFNIQATTRVDYFKDDFESFLKKKKSHFILSLTFAALVAASFSVVNIFPIEYVLLMIVACIFRTLSLFVMTLFQCNKEAMRYTLCNFLYSVILAFTVYICVNLGMGEEGWVYGVVVASFMQLGIALSIGKFIVLCKVLACKVNNENLKITFFSAAIFLPQAIGWWLKSGADRFIISTKAGNEILGNFAIAFQISSVPVLAIGVLNLVLLPNLNYLLAKKEYTKASSLLYKFALLGVVVTLLSFFLGKVLIGFYYSEKYIYASEYFNYFILATLFHVLILVFTNYLYYEGGGVKIAKAISLVFIIQALLAFVIIDYFGVIGMLVLSVFSNLILMIYIIYLFKKSVSIERCNSVNI
ncbi:hypothetical protein DS891_16790 [Pseudoalteromonas sp. JC28]|uniref:lipopolysaccharide biosynthesis protein n=1 Tax=Pseudoalteromonas sp. JC28 TaxID=2267617 RepID=UPI001571C306|nr:oligosaccharide flippase family protein [Pseudoalteromonas sp. JC28]NSY35198.1 hypothetical protein [Pseudoalteromonas sp. JC28]